MERMPTRIIPTAAKATERKEGVEDGFSKVEVVVGGIDVDGSGIHSSSLCSVEILWQFLVLTDCVCD